MPLVIGKPGGTEHDKPILGDPQFRTHGGIAPAAYPGLRVNRVEDHIGDKLFLSPVAHRDHLVLLLIQHPVGKPGHGVIGNNEMVGINHPDLLIITLRQHGNIVFPQIVAVDEVDIPLLTELAQSLGRLPVKAVIHGKLPGGDPHGLQPLHQESALIVGKIGLYPSVGGEIFHQGLHIPLGPRLAGIVEQIQHFHLPPPPLEFLLPYSTGKRRKNQPAFRCQAQKRQPPGIRKDQELYPTHTVIW